MSHSTACVDLLISLFFSSLYLDSFCKNKDIKASEKVEHYVEP